MPAAGSDKLIIANHAMGFTRSGLPTHLEQRRSAWESSGNTRRSRPMTRATMGFPGPRVGGQFEVPAGGQLVGSYLAMRPVTERGSRRTWS